MFQTKRKVKSDYYDEWADTYSGKQKSFARCSGNKKVFGNEKYLSLVW
jgi:hypothetical protein